MLHEIHGVRHAWRKEQNRGPGTGAEANSAPCELCLSTPISAEEIAKNQQEIATSKSRAVDICSIEACIDLPEEAKDDDGLHLENGVQ